MFNAQRLALARARRGLTAKALAEKTGLRPNTITRLEQGRNEPSPETIEALSSALDYPASFFDGDAVEPVDVEAVSFRSFSKMTARERDAAIGAGSLGLLLGDWVEERFGLPEPDLLDLSHETNPEAAAIYLRRHWGIGQQPIGHLLALLETKGVRLFSLCENTASVNAFSFWRGGKPYVYLNTFKSAESSRFDAAHELGHLVLHKHGSPRDNRACEREADRFASAFLMPSDDIKAHISRLVSVDSILRAKIRWRVSAMALAHRLHDLCLVSDWQYKSICIELSRRGYRTKEPGGIARETSVIWKKVLTQLWSERVSRHDIAKMLKLPADEIEGLIGGMINQLPAPPPRRAPSLGLV